MPDHTSIWQISSEKYKHELQKWMHASNSAICLPAARASTEHAKRRQHVARQRQTTQNQDTLGARVLAPAPCARHSIHEETSHMPAASPHTQPPHPPPFLAPHSSENVRPQQRQKSGATRRICAASLDARRRRCRPRRSQAAPRRLECGRAPSTRRRKSDTFEMSAAQDCSEVCIYMHTQICVSNMCVCTSVCTYICMCICTYAYLRSRHMYMYVCIHTHTHTHTHTHV